MKSDHSAIKRNVIHNIGVSADDWLDSAKREHVASLGGCATLRKLAHSLGSVQKRIDDDIDADRLPTEPLEIAKYAKLQVQRCIDAALNAAVHEERVSIAAQGAVSAYTQTVSHLQKLVTAEEAKEAALVQALADGTIIMEGAEPVLADDVSARARPAGVRPGKNVAKTRKQEAQATAQGDGENA